MAQMRSDSFPACALVARAANVVEGLREHDTMDADLDRLLGYLPPRLATAFTGDHREVVELALDLGRPPIVRLPHGFWPLDTIPLTREEIDYVIDRVGRFRRNNRAGIDHTLHRISLVRDRYGDPAGLTVRIGRHLSGVADGIRDLLLDRQESLLLVGTPGVGKTTLLRDCARLVSERLGPAVIIVDSHNEIGGDGVLPHQAIGAARRMQVPDGATQYDVLLEAVRNHFPEVVIVDEITTRQEADAARTIARRGIRLLATAHGSRLADIVNNPELVWLVGGSVEAPLRSTEPHARQRSEPPVMGLAAEVRPGRQLAVYLDVAQAVDAICAMDTPEPDEIRPLPVPVQHQPPPPPQRVRTHPLVPEGDPWGMAIAVARP